jgi:hypothetical protein
MLYEVLDAHGAVIGQQKAAYARLVEHGRAASRSGSAEAASVAVGGCSRHGTMRASM